MLNGSLHDTDARSASSPEAFFVASNRLAATGAAGQR